jgi:Protein of unknown function (DUF2793)
MPDVTDRLSLPLLVAGQAQKEVTHNEALTLIDFLAQPVVVAVAPVSVPAAPTLGQSWIVGAAPTGAWAGKAAHIASWTSGGWRFCAPNEQCLEHRSRNRIDAINRRPTGCWSAQSGDSQPQRWVEH